MRLLFLWCRSGKWWQKYANAEWTAQAPLSQLIKLVWLLAADERKCNGKLCSWRHFDVEHILLRRTEEDAGIFHADGLNCARLIYQFSCGRPKSIIQCNERLIQFAVWLGSPSNWQLRLQFSSVDSTHKYYKIDTFPCSQMILPSSTDHVIKLHYHYNVVCERWMHSDITPSCNVQNVTQCRTKQQKSEQTKSNDKIKFGEQSKFFFVRFFYSVRC